MCISGNLVVVGGGNDSSGAEEGHKEWVMSCERMTAVLDLLLPIVLF